MSAQIGSILGKQAQALYFHAQRAELLAGNIANAETPGYKSRDVDFRAVLRDTGVASSGLAQSNSRHMSAAGNHFSASTFLREPAQSSINGNTVDMSREQSAYAENAVRYQINLRFLDGKIKGLMLALRGD